MLKVEMQTDGANVYRTPRGIRLVESILLPCFALMLILGFDTFWLPSFQNRWLFGLVSSTALFVYGPILVFWLVWQGVFVDRLNVTTDGIEFYGLGVSGHVGWQDMDAFGMVRWGGSVAWGVKLAEDPRFSISLMTRFFGRGWMFDRFIPLSYWQDVRYQGWRKGQVDLERFKRTELGQEFLRFAPHLFEKSI